MKSTSRLGTAGGHDEHCQTHCNKDIEHKKLGNLVKAFEDRFTRNSARLGDSWLMIMNELNHHQACLAGPCVDLSRCYNHLSRFRPGLQRKRCWISRRQLDDAATLAVAITQPDTFRRTLRQQNLWFGTGIPVPNQKIKMMAWRSDLSDVYIRLHIFNKFMFANSEMCTKNRSQ